jgi:Pyruvate/2-oxoacid:ferredoxin oxidoreductase delta subunit
MKEAFVILAVLGVVLFLTAIRYRRQIAAGVQIWRSMKAMREQFKQQTGKTVKAKPVDAGKLVNCAKCGTWVPEQKAIMLRDGSAFCSQGCLESVAAPR